MRVSNPLPGIRRTKIHGYMPFPLRDLNLPLTALATMLGALFLHEAGHAAATYLTGGAVIRIVLLSEVPHIEYSGVGTAATEALRAISGSGLVISLSFAILMLFGWTSIFTRTLAFFSLAEFAGWIFSASFPDQAPNDASAFIARSGLPPHVVGFASFAVALACCSLIAIRSKRRELNWQRICTRMPGRFLCTTSRHFKQR